MVKVWQSWRGTALQEAVLDISWDWGRKLSDLKGISDEEENCNKKIFKYNSKWTPRGMGKKLSSVVNITVTKGEDVSFRIKLGSISYGKVLQHWDKVPGEVGNASSLSVLKRQCP